VHRILVILVRAAESPEGTWESSWGGMPDSGVRLARGSLCGNDVRMLWWDLLRHPQRGQ